MVKKLDYNFSVDKKRRDCHLDALRCYQAEWSRRDGMLYGDFGRMLYREITDIFAAGPANESGAGIKHMHIINSLDTSWHVQQRFVDQLSMIHRRPFEIDGDIAQSIAWDQLRAESNIDAVLQTKLDYVIALGSCGIRPRMTDGCLPGLSVVTPDRLTVIPHPGNDSKPMIVIEYGADSIMVWDMSDRKNPKWQSWRNITAWRSAYESGIEASDRNMLMDMSGDEYPWTWQGKPIMPWVFYQRGTSLDILPVDRHIVRDTISVIMQRSHIGYISYVGSMSRPIIMSDKELDGAGQALLDASVLINLFGEGGKTVEIIPDAMDSVSKQWEIHGDRVMDILGRYDLGLQVRRSEAAKSGIAIQLELSGLWQFRAQQETQNRNKDVNVIKMLIASMNHMIRAGQITGDDVDFDLELLPEESISIRYPVAWTAQEKADLLSQIRNDIQVGLKTRVDYYLADHDLPDTEANRQMALEYYAKAKIETDNHPND